MFNLKILTFPHSGNLGMLILHGPGEGDSLSHVEFGRLTSRRGNDPVSIAWIIRDLHGYERALANYHGPCGPDDMLGDYAAYCREELIERGVNPWAVADEDGWRHDAEFADEMWADYGPDSERGGKLVLA